MPSTRGVAREASGGVRSLRRTVAPLQGLRRRVALRAPASPPRLAPEHPDRVGHPHGALGRDRGERREACSTGPTWTRRRGAAKAPDVPGEAPRLCHDRQSAELARIVARHTCRRGMAIRAEGFRRAGTRCDKERRAAGETCSTTKPGRVKGSTGMAIQ
jgi:hypothetical protein